ncbi:MAG: SulP family inorganic anion transporter, partial [Acidimicrobiales bacterium]|nr:SulP family inorganic anion transporter [Acidimicrobiales bacterium]
TTVAALVIYAIVGPSRFLLLGPDSSLAPLIAATVTLAVAGDSPEHAIAVGSLLALSTGAICIAAGFANLGSIAELLSRPVQLGYLNGLAIVMVISQLSKLFGFSVSSSSPPRRLLETLEGIADGQTDAAALTIGGLALVGMVALASHPRIPMVFVAVVAATVAVWAFDLTDLDVIGEVPRGFPTPAVPDLDAGDLTTIFAASFGLAWVTLTDTTALSRGFARRTRETVDPNREIIALGASNMAAGAFAGFPVSASTTRTSLAYASGGRSKAVGLISALLLVILLFVGSDLIAKLPVTALAAIVIAAAIALFDLHQLRWLASVRRSEFQLAVITMIAVVTVGVLNGLLIAVGLSIANFVRRVWRPYDAVLGRIDQRLGYHDVSRNPDGRQVPGLLVFRFDAPLFFANSDYFLRRINNVLADSEVQPVKRLIIAAEPVSDVDTSGAEALSTLLDRLERQRIEFGFAALHGPVKDVLYAYGLYDRIGADRFYETVGMATRAYIEDHNIDWTDWTERD